MGKFVVIQEPTGVNFHLLAANAETIGTSQVYASKETLMVGVESVKKNCTIAHLEDQTVANYEEAKCPKWVVYLDKAEKFRFRLLASNGLEILASQHYTTKANCLNGIESVKKNAPEAEVVEEEK